MNKGRVGYDNERTTSGQEIENREEVPNVLAPPIHPLAGQAAELVPSLDDFSYGLEIGHGSRSVFDLVPSRS